MLTKNSSTAIIPANAGIYKITLFFILTCGTLFHIWALGLNEVLRESDSIAYLQMSHFLKQFSVEGFWSGWFGFFYSLPIALLDMFLENDILSGKIVNIVLLNISGILLYTLSKKILSPIYALFTLWLFLVSPTFLHFNIHILSENIYIPIFLMLFLTTWNFVEKVKRKSNTHMSSLILIACLLWLLYLTRAEGFIYMLSIGFLSIVLLVQKKLTLSQFFLYGGVFLISFTVFICPYLIHLHSLTGEWGLTNKWVSNYRQAELRGTEKMDDAGFEQAVGELTPDKHHLIAGFAGGMEYDAPQIEGSFMKSLSENKKEVLQRILSNQKKVFTKNIPEIFLGKSPSLFWSADSRFRGNTVFLLFSLFPLLILLLGVWKVWKQERVFALVCVSFFLPAFVFFTLFFTLNRYFIIFLPLLYIIFSYGLQEMKCLSRSAKIYVGFHLVAVLLLSNMVYYNSEKEKDSYYQIKKESGIWLSQNNFIQTESNIMERFPIVTYYSGSKNRWITPYTDDVSDIIEYAKYNSIEYLVVDTLDFLTYRPALAGLLEETPNGMALVKEWKNEKGQKVRVYKIQGK
jgi:Dolichyl-phosphate-mannose-protein mannosyltransferase